MSEYEYESNDPESQANKAEYNKLIDNIKRRMNPASNTVLLVDDERSIRRRVARDLKKNDSSLVIFEAENGQEALDLLAEVREKYSRDPLFIVLDLNMPVMNGWEVIETLRKDYEAKGQPQGIPIIVLSSTSGETGFAFFKKSVHGGKAHYSPLVTVAKEACINPGKYDASGEKGLISWMKYFMRGN